ncbi:DUF952 domain-containing protein [Brevundimonas viscosa]|uniref:Uncharacterized conserved protein, DUF952 family n=1 Tax=Brevundimonas viscosa TaxID=871741 RepID=A0A1I6QLE4_9CAUL|nr:DUF952 domain-containing protein [Brevundimonas viscosa]SFS53285.1 Uncharacterized conserved protein, DUF952 family [Brevundimonas viscosa]
MSGIAYKLVDADEWHAAGDAYGGSAVDLADGYIHMSTSGQLAETAARHYRGRESLLLLDVETARLGDAVVWEPSRGGALFPHVYGPLPRSAVVSERGLAVDADGVMHFDDGTVGWD